MFEIFIFIIHSPNEKKINALVPEKSALKCTLFRNHSWNWLGASHDSSCKKKLRDDDDLNKMASNRRSTEICSYFLKTWE